MSDRLTPEALRECANAPVSIAWTGQARQLLRWAADCLEAAAPLSAENHRLQSDLAERDKVARDRLREIERLQQTVTGAQS